MENNSNLLSEELYIDNGIKGHLKETTMWAKVLGITGFVVSGIIAIAAPFIPQVMNDGTFYSGSEKQMIGITTTILYLIIAGFSFMVSLFLYRFSRMTKRAMEQTDQDTLEKGFQNLKFLFRTYGILTVIYIGMMAIAILIAITTALFAS